MTRCWFVMDNEINKTDHVVTCMLVIVKVIILAFSLLSLYSDEVIDCDVAI